jgi:hypothetical protein
MARGIQQQQVILEGVRAMKVTTEKQPSSFIGCEKKKQFANVDACKGKKCSAKCEAFRKYEHGA